MEVTIVIVALIAYVGFRQWLRHHRRIMIHRERLAAVEKGIDLPPLEQEVGRNSWNVQRVLLLAGLCWIAIGIGASAVVASINSHPDNSNLPQGLEWIGLAPVGIGVAHVVVYLVGKKRER